MKTRLPAKRRDERLNLKDLLKKSETGTEGWKDPFTSGSSPKKNDVSRKTEILHCST